MDDTYTWFLLVQYKRAGRTKVTEFDDPDAATDAYGDAERRFADRIRSREVDVLLVGASTLDAVRENYPSYFLNARTNLGKIRELRKLLAALPPAALQ